MSLSSSSLDSSDLLSSFRSEFSLPSSVDIRKLHATQSAKESEPANEPATGPAVYLSGNSLGALPRRSVRFVNEEFTTWSSIGVEGHFHGSRPWARIDEKSCEMAAKLFGASNSEIAIANSLSLNLQLLLVAFYRPDRVRRKILIEGSAFCSDHHIVRSQLAYHGLKESELIQLEPREGEFHLRLEDIEESIAKAGDELALILLPGVQFYTGQLFDIRALSAAAHRVGALAAFDLAHAVGNVPLSLHDWGVDFAVWCSYKYLNSGPGSIGGLFVHSRHDQFLSAAPLLDGWWGQPAESRFLMKPNHERARGAKAFQLSNPSVLNCVCLEASLEIFLEAGMDRIREKSIKLTGFLESLLKDLSLRISSSSPPFRLITPSNPSERGCQLSLLFPRDCSSLISRLLSLGVVADFRRPNVIRVAPAPLYNSFKDCEIFVQKLEQIIKEEKIAEEK